MSKSRQLSDAINSVDISESAPADAVTLDASGNLHIGKTATNFAVTGATLKGDGTAQFTRGGDQVALFNRLTSDGTIIDLRKDGTTVGQINTVNSDMIIGSNDVGLYFDSVNDQIRPATATGNTVRGSAIDLGRAGGGFKDLYLSGGVYLGGTGAANYLDDYEEGTWTPFYHSTGTPPTVTTYDNTVLFGKYVKVGNVVHLTGAIRTDNVASVGTGNLQIGGLPFNPSLGTSNRASGTIGVSSGFSSTNAPQTLYLRDGGVYLDLVSSLSSDGRDVLGNNVATSSMTTGAVANLHEVYFAITYMVS